MSAREGSGFNWLMGCSIGCCGLLIVAAIAGGLAYSVGKSWFANVHNEIRTGFQKAYGMQVEEGKVPQEHREFIDSVVAISTGDKAGFFAVSATGPVLLKAIEDGELTEEELGVLTALKEFLEQNPAPNPKELGEFMESHPDVKKAINATQGPYGYIHEDDGKVDMKITVPESEDAK